MNNLFKVENSQSISDLIVKRNPTSGEILDFYEVVFKQITFFILLEKLINLNLLKQGFQSIKLRCTANTGSKIRRRSIRIAW